MKSETIINKETAKRISGVNGIEIYLIENTPIKPRNASFKKIPKSKS